MDAAEEIRGATNQGLHLVDFGDIGRLHGKAVAAACSLMLNGLILYAGERWRPRQSKVADEQVEAERTQSALPESAAEPALATVPSGQRVGGRHASGHQAVRHKLADMATSVHTCRCVTHDALRRFVAGEDPLKEVTMAKLLTQRASF